LGRYQNVVLSDKEQAELQADLPTVWQEYIELLSEYMASTGRIYKSHAATIRGSRRHTLCSSPNMMYWRRDYLCTRSNGTILATGERFEDGTHIMYVNGAYRDETPIGKLMHDFSCTDPADMYYGILADRVRFFKESKEGVAIMCKAMEDIRNQTLREGMMEVAHRMLAAGKYALEEIAEISGLSLDEVKKLQTGQSA